MLQILSICFFNYESSVLLSSTNMILRQFFCEGARKIKHLRSPMYFVQLGKFEYNSKSKLMSRFIVLTMVKPQAYFFWQTTKSPEQFSCHYSPSICMKSLVLVTKRTTLPSFSNLHCNYFSRSGSIFMKACFEYNDWQFKIFKIDNFP